MEAVLNNHICEQEARDFGIDISCLEYNLTLTPEQRLWQNQQMLNILNAIQSEET